MPGETIYGLTAKDRALLMEVVSYYRRTSAGKNPNPDPRGDQDFLAPEVYLAHTEAAGIPAASNAGTTGTGRDAEDDLFGSAELTIYRTIKVGSTYRPTSLGITRVILNTSFVAIAAWKWIVVVRDKFGDWYVPNIGLDFTECP